MQMTAMIVPQTHHLRRRVPPVVEESPFSPQSKFYSSLPKCKWKIPLYINNVRMLTSEQVDTCLSWYFRQPLPCTDEMFPWLHGLHEENIAQRHFFLRQPWLVEKPRTARFLMCISTDDDAQTDPFITSSLTAHNILGFRQLASQKVLRNTIKLSDILRKVDVSRIEVRQIVSEILENLYPESCLTEEIELFTRDCLQVRFLPIFLNLDPDQGVSLRNFHIQVAKLATCSDFLVYGSNKLDSYARVLWLAQQHEAFMDGISQTSFSIFIHSESINDLDMQLSWHNDFFIKEKVETCRMASATKIWRQVWIGNHWDYNALIGNASDYEQDSAWSHMYCDPKHSVVTLQDTTNLLAELPKAKANWQFMFHCHVGATFPPLTVLSQLIYQYAMQSRDDTDELHVLDFPPSGSIGIGDCKKENLSAVVNTCKLLYLVSSSTSTSPDVVSSLIYCSDGYTESSLLVLCFVMYSLDLGLGDAMIKLHMDYGRPFFIFPSDVVILEKLEALLRRYSPMTRDIDWLVAEEITSQEINEILLPAVNPAQHQFGFIVDDSDEEMDEIVTPTSWVNDTNGSLPSRILPDLYLGSLDHANCPHVLTKLGITTIVSVGEQLNWTQGLPSRFEEDCEVISIPDSMGHSVERVLKVNNIQDDGIDDLSRHLSMILDFLKAEPPSSKVLVHCRVGVSRSATVVIAEVMRRLNLTIPEAYLYVRVRRLNVIIQPNLRFMYELFKWEEQQRVEAGYKHTNLREVDWFIMCREIMKLNLPYCTK